MTDVTAPEKPARKGKTLEPSYNRMEDAPDDGKSIIIFGEDGKTAEVFWRHTRAWDRNGGKWRTVGFWALWGSGGQRCPWEPIGWLPKWGEKE